MFKHKPRAATGAGWKPCSGSVRRAAAGGRPRSLAGAVRLSFTRRTGRPTAPAGKNRSSCAMHAPVRRTQGQSGAGRHVRCSSKGFRGNSIVVEQPGYSVDTPLFIAVVTLVLLGLVIAYATTYHLGWAHVQGHAMRVALGLLALTAGIALPHRWYGGRARWVILALGLGLLILTLFFGRTVKGADRWLVLPLLNIPIQPAEIAKFALPFWLAAHFADQEAQCDSDRGFASTVLLPALVMLAFLVPTLLQRAIGTTFIMAASALAIFLLAGVRWRHFALLLGVVLALVGCGILMFPHGWERLVGFLDGQPWQQEQSKIAIARGQFWGQWLTGSKQAVFFLPEVRTDFAVAAVCEEFGFLGSIGVFGLYGLFLWRGMEIGRRTPGHFGRYLSAGIAVTVFLYAMVHIAVAVGLLPTTGQPLPFVSYGGTAMAANLFAAGVLLNVSRYEKRAHGSGLSAYPARASRAAVS